MTDKNKHTPHTHTYPTPTIHHSLTRSVCRSTHRLIMISVPIIFDHGSGAMPPPGGRRMMSHVVDRSVCWSLDRSVLWSVARSVGQSLDRSVLWSVAHSVGQSVAWSVRKSVSRSVGQSVASSLGRSVAWSVG